MEGWKKLLKSFGFGFQGIFYTIKTQRNMKIHLFVAIIVLLVFRLVSPPLIHVAIILIVIFLVFAFEMINTAIEVIVDMVSPEFHPLAKAAKDIAAGAVLTMAILSVIVGSILLLPDLWKKIAEIL
ncbi:diacylglycerol kinase family protein [Microaerobacter geothermalis]|uniref:diacylglycerol kinase family protein n=1 Tax=Microaerobacter geothermalis TaxID=674972 RepID=UPI001F363100|nr:diacylglycerol kinase family protein [Microaerobacter geothermalis]MCF6092822.1 diacylglycerol kinase family protein [Microaerobacter geothermalis]